MPECLVYAEDKSGERYALAVVCAEESELPAGISILAAKWKDDGWGIGYVLVRDLREDERAVANLHLSDWQDECRRDCKAIWGYRAKFRIDSDAERTERAAAVHVIWNTLAQVARAGKRADDMTPEAKHSEDYTFVNWYGTEYTFALGVQSSAVRALWDEWQKSGLGLHQDTIRDGVDPERDNFRMDTAFRNHPAFGTMIQRCGDGRYKLAPPAMGTSPPVPK